MQKVLIVDDSTLFRNSLREILHSRLPSLVISEANDREGALEMTETFLPDLIFMDIHLPDGNGLELTRTIRELHHDVKIVILSNYDIPEYREAAFRYKADQFIAKDTFMSVLGSILPETLSG